MIETIIVLIILACVLAGAVMFLIAEDVDEYRQNRHTMGDFNEPEDHEP